MTEGRRATMREEKNTGADRKKDQRKKKAESLMRADGAIGRAKSFAALCLLSRLFTRCTRTLLYNALRLPGYQRSRCARVN